MENIPIVTLDKIYIIPDGKNIYFLDCTRINGSDEIISRRGKTLEQQIMELSSDLSSKKIILADDVIFSGSVIRNIINRFDKYGITVVGVVSSVCTSKAYEYFNKNLKYGIRCAYLLENNVIDQICERDFYFGIAGSGIMVSTENGLYKAPYFKPYGNPCERASIPEEYESFFSRGCLERSIYLWEEMERVKGTKFLMADLPEKIIGTEKEQEVVKVLRMEMKNI